MIDRGAVRFDLREGWTAEPGDGGSLRLHDQPPPDDECRIEVSVLRLPVAVGAGGLPPLAALLAGATRGVDLDVVARSAPVRTRRSGLDAASSEIRHRDIDGTGGTGEVREALWRCCIARGGGVHAVLSMSTWVDAIPRFDPVWDEVLETLEVGAHYDLAGRDPRRN